MSAAPVPSSNATPLVDVQDLHVRFPIYGGILRHEVGSVRAVDGVSILRYY